jgi:hypothetical protein
MKDLIQKIEAEILSNSDGKPVSQGYNAGLNTALEILRSQKTIRAKALRKKGTNEFYYLDGQDLEWIDWGVPIPYDGDFDSDKEDGDLPEDAELINITIIIEP